MNIHKLKHQLVEHYFVSKRLFYRLRNYLQLYHPPKTELTFKEIICSKLTNEVVGCMYKHPKLQINDFKSDSISPLLLLKLQKESSKRIFLLGNFKACVCYFLTNFYFPLNDSPWKTMKDVFYFIQKALFIFKIFKFLYFDLPLFFCLSTIALELDPRQILKFTISSTV